MLTVIYADCHISALYSECCCAEGPHADCHYAECRYAECHYAECHGTIFPQCDRAITF